VIVPHELTEANVKVTMGGIDDLNFNYPPETFPGSINFVYTDWDFSDVSKRGKHHLYLEFYTPPHYKRGDEVQFLNYMDHPLKIKIGSLESDSQPLLKPEYEKRYKKHYTVKAIKKHLEENPM
jgi:hypothetical protein